MLLKSYRTILALMPPQCKKDMVVVVAFMLLNGVLELAGVTGILPLMVAATDPQAPRENKIVGWLYSHLGLTDYNRFLIALAVGMCVLFTLVNLCGATNLYLSHRFGEDFRHYLSRNMLDRYLSRPYAWFLSNNSTTLTKDVLSEVDAVTAEVVVRLIQLTTGLVSSTLIFLGLLYLEPVVALSTVFILAVVYRLIYAWFKKKLNAIGEERVAANTGRFKSVSQAISSVKEVRSFETRPYFIRAYEQPSLRYREVQVVYYLMAETPRYVTETLAVVAILGVMTYLVLSGYPAVIPLMALYIMATWRLVPAVQSVYRNIIRVQFHRPALDQLHQQLAVPPDEGWEIKEVPTLPLHEAVAMSEVEFSYPNAERPALRNVNLTILKNSSLALVGRTGEGKSTLADVLAGFLVPQKGEVRVDGTALTPATRACWRKNVGSIPQDIYLLDDTVRRNIALGIPDEEIDEEAVTRAARIAHIHEFVTQELEHGYDTTLGERGISLSGGQRQRIGIARALYHDPEVLILDEATSSLDKMTEKAVMEAIGELLGSKTLILIAHRLSTVKVCDRVCLVDKGGVRAFGTFEEVRQTDDLFGQMVELELGEPDAAD